MTDAPGIVTLALMPPQLQSLPLITPGDTNATSALLFVPPLALTPRALTIAQVEGGATIWMAYVMSVASPQTGARGGTVVTFASCHPDVERMSCRSPLGHGRQQLRQVASVGLAP